MKKNLKEAISGLYVGIVTALRASTFGNEGHRVINITIGTPHKVFGGVDILKEHVLVMWRENATRAEADLNIGDNLLFGSVLRCPRIGQLDNGNIKEVVDLESNSYEKISKKKLINGLKNNADELIPESTFIFTEKDRANCIANAVATAQDDVNDIL